MDLKYVARQLLRRPGHTLAVIACLVIGLVASVGTFSVITSLFYGDMPGIAARRSLARVFLRYDSPTESESGGGGRRIVTAPLSFNDFAIMRELPADSALDAIGAEGDLRMTAAGSHGPVWISGAFVSGDFFRALRTTPLRGRFLSPEDDRPAAAPVAVVTEYFWRTHLDGRDDAIGRPVLLGGTSFTVIGVAPPRFHGMQFLDPGQDDSNGVQAWIPLALAPQWPTRPSLDTGWLTVVGRVKAGLTTVDVERQLTVSAARIAASQPTTRANAAPRVRAHGFGPDAAPIQIFALVIALLALPLIVLAIGCANVANLHLARVAEQSRELAVRLALGASRAQLVRLLTLETLARVLVAVGLSIGLILLTLARVQAMVPVFVSIDWRVLLFAVSLALGVSLATGLMPAWIVLRRTAAGELKQGSQSGGLRHSRLRGALIVGQVALSLGLMVLAGLFTRTSQAMVNDAPRALRQQMVASFDPSELRMTPLEARRFADTLAAGAAADGRVTHVALSIDDSVRFGLPGAPRTSDRECVARRHDRRMGRRHGGQATHRPATDRCGRPHDRHAEREGRRDDRARDFAARHGASRRPWIECRARGSRRSHSGRRRGQPASSDRRAARPGDLRAPSKGAERRVHPARARRRSRGTARRSPDARQPDRCADHLDLDPPGRHAIPGRGAGDGGRDLCRRRGRHRGPGPVRDRTLCRAVLPRRAPSARDRRAPGNRRSALSYHHSGGPPGAEARAGGHGVRAGAGCADGVRDARDVRRQSHRHRSDGFPADDLGAARRWHPRGRRPRPSCVSNRSDRHTAAGIGIAFARWCRRATAGRSSSHTRELRPEFAQLTSPP